MPSVRFRAGRPSYYLDTSTLSYAWRGGTRDDPAEFAALRPWVERIANADNLCLSTMHIAELAQGDEERARATLEWIDTLDTVWMYSFDKVRQREDERALHQAVGIAAPADVAVFAPSLLSLFNGWGLDAVAEALAGPSPLRNLAAAARVKGIASERATMGSMVAALHYDRHLDPKTQRMTDAEKQASLTRKRRELLRREAAEACERLRVHGDRAFHAAYRSCGDPGEAFADFVLANAESLPCSFVLDHREEAQAAVAARAWGRRAIGACSPNRAPGV